MDGPSFPPPPPSLCSNSNIHSETTVKMTNIDSLPDELLFDILVRLPADFLHDIARLVRRRWGHIIRSDAFIKHFQQHSTYGLVLSSLVDCYPHSIYVTATQQGRIKKTDLSNDKFRTTSSILACCNGLALQLHFSHVEGKKSSVSLYVINPATKRSLLLPSVSVPFGSTVRHERCGIAYSAASMEYKVTLPYRTHTRLACLDIVTVGVDKSWRRVEIPPLHERDRSLFNSFPLSSEGGFLHWGQLGTRCSLTLNVETEMITMSEPPIPPDQCYDHYWHYYLSTGRYLSLLVRRGKLLWDVWEMRPAESGEWREAVLPNIDLEPQKRWLQQQFGYDDYTRLDPVGWVKYPEVLALSFGRLERTCIFYNLVTHEINTIKLPYNAYHDYKAFVHKNTLVWLTQDD